MTCIKKMPAVGFAALQKQYAAMRDARPASVPSAAPAELVSFAAPDVPVLSQSPRSPPIVAVRSPAPVGLCVTTSGGRARARQYTVLTLDGNNAKTTTMDLGRTLCLLGSAEGPVGDGDWRPHQHVDVPTQGALTTLRRNVLHTELWLLAHHPRTISLFGDAAPPAVELPARVTFTWYTDEREGNLTGDCMAGVVNFSHEDVTKVPLPARMEAYVFLS